MAPVALAVNNLLSMAVLIFFVHEGITFDVNIWHLKRPSCRIANEPLWRSQIRQHFPSLKKWISPLVLRRYKAVERVQGQYSGISSELNRSIKFIQAHKAHRQGIFTFDISHFSSAHIVNNAEIIFEYPFNNRLAIVVKTRGQSARKYQEFYTKLSKRTDEGYAINITSLLKRQLTWNKKTLRMHVHLHNGVYSHTHCSRHLNYTLIVYENIKKPLPERDIGASENYSLDETMKKPSLERYFGSDEKYSLESRNKKRKKRNLVSSDESQICQLNSWIIDFEQMLNWTFIRHPLAYEANVCKGRCPSTLRHSYFNATSYTFMKNLYLFNMHYENVTVPGACCIPIQFDSQPVIISDQVNSELTEIQIMENMIVKRCACR